MRLVATKLFLCMAVVRKKWRYGFKLAKKVLVSHTGSLRALITSHL